MPNTRQGGGYTLTFAKKNLDVKRVIDEKKKSKVTITDYICECVRFYEENKNIDIKELIQEEVNKSISQILRGINVNTISENNLQQKKTSVSLEDDLEGINIDED